MTTPLPSTVREHILRRRARRPAGQPDRPWRFPLISPPGEPEPPKTDEEKAAWKAGVLGEAEPESNDERLREVYEAGRRHGDSPFEPF